MSRYRREVVQQSEQWLFIADKPFEVKKEYASKLAKAYNKRLMRLEKADVQSSAYKQMIYENGSHRFYTGKKYINESAVNEAIKRMLNFGTMESSTLSGYKAGWKRRLKTYRENHPEMDIFTDDELIDLFESGFGTDFKYTSDEDMKTAKDLKEQGVTVDEMVDAVESLKEKNVGSVTEYELLKTAKSMHKG